MPSKSIHIAANDKILFFFLGGLSISVPHCVCIPYLLYPFVYYGHLDYFNILAIVNNAAMNIRVHVSFRVVDKSLCTTFISRSGIDASEYA